VLALVAAVVAAAGTPFVPPAESERQELRRARCPEATVNCEEARGSIIAVERVDPDGDGDAHFVLASAQSITAPGISVVDVRADLRPDPLPGPGDRLSAAGPVYPGSFGQSQIQAEVVRVARTP
jgi:hypothetical protein